jgi:hypothetical protein
MASCSHRFIDGCPRDTATYVRRRQLFAGSYLGWLSAAISLGMLYFLSPISLPAVGYLNCIVTFDAVRLGLTLTGY